MSISHSMNTESHESEEKVIPQGTLLAERYTVEKLLGRGAMAQVYLVSDSLLGGHRLALKLIHAELVVDTKSTQRFMKEIELTHRVNHPNVVRTYDVGSYGNRSYFTMEYLYGLSFEDIPRHHFVDSDTAAHLIEQLIQGLHAVHSVGIIHRDIKPTNILVTPEFVVKLTDFGIARTADSTLTQAGCLIGSLGYVAPEIWKGDQPSVCSDLYGVGVTLYECVTGTPFCSSDDPAAVMGAHLLGKPIAPRMITADVPIWLDRMIMRLLAKDPVGRPQSLAELLYYIRHRDEYNSPRGNAFDAQAEIPEVDDLLGAPAATLPPDVGHTEKKLVESVRQRKRKLLDELEDRQQLVEEEARRRKLGLTIMALGSVFVGGLGYLAFTISEGRSPYQTYLNSQRSYASAPSTSWSLNPLTYLPNTTSEQSAPLPLEASWTRRQEPWFQSPGGFTIGAPVLPSMNAALPALAAANGGQVARYVPPPAFASGERFSASTIQFLHPTPATLPAVASGSDVALPATTTPWVGNLNSAMAVYRAPASAGGSSGRSTGKTRGGNSEVLGNTSKVSFDPNTATELMSVLSWQATLSTSSIPTADTAELNKALAFHNLAQPVRERVSLLSLEIALGSASRPLEKEAERVRLLQQSLVQYRNDTTQRLQQALERYATWFREIKQPLDPESPLVAELAKEFPDVANDLKEMKSQLADIAVVSKRLEVAIATAVQARSTELLCAVLNAASAAESALSAVSVIERYNVFLVEQDGNSSIATAEWKNQLLEKKAAGLEELARIRTQAPADLETLAASLATVDRIVAKGAQ